MTDVQNLFDKPVKNNLRTYDNIQQIETGSEDDYATGCLLDYNYFKKYYKMIAIDLSKQQALEGDPKAIQQFFLLEIWIEQDKKTLFFVIEEAKETILGFSQGTIEVL